MRIGSGHDEHRLVPGRPLLLGGISIPHPKGLDGHSDADVVLHALTDAILGALAEGDIGDRFPDTDPKWLNADSRLFLEAAHKLMADQGYQLVNADITIFAQEPKLGSHKAIIRQNLAYLLQVELRQINVKAKTGERVGHIGRSEAIACHAVCLLESRFDPV